MTGSDVIAPQWMRQLWHRGASLVVKRLHGIMSCGMTPRKIALTLCIGCAIGTMPLPWGTTLICIGLAHWFRLNHVAMQSVNYLLYPVQLALLVPFFKLGAWLFPWGPPVPANMLALVFRHPGLSSLNMLGWILLKSLAAWLVTVVPAMVIILGILIVTMSGKDARETGP